MELHVSFIQLVHIHSQLTNRVTSGGQEGLQGEVVYLLINNSHGHSSIR